VRVGVLWSDLEVAAEMIEYYGPHDRAVAEASTAMHQTPHSLLERMRLRPDAASWRRLVDLYTPLLQAWLRRYDVPAADVDDLVQEVLAVLVHELPAFQHNQRRGAFRRWLRTIALNRLKGYWRGRQTGPRTLPGAEAAQVLEQVADPASDPDRHWEQEHDQFIVRRALELLEPEFTPSTWQAFRRQVIDGARPAEVAAELGLSAHAALLAKFRVLRRLRREVDGLTD
jgi:RNA polymerase sigma-70 factor (ECF subfamily)